MRRSTMMKPVVRDAEIKFLVRELKFLGVVITPPKRRELITGQPGIQIGNCHIGESRLQQNVSIHVASANDQHFHFSGENPFVD